jgi:hypothetical protein
MPMRTETHEERVAFQKRVKSELPAYLAHLIKLQVPEELQASRYGILAYQNPEIVKAMNDIAPEFRLLELIDQHFEEMKKPWVGTASELETELTGELSNVSAQARKLLHYFNTCGTYLGRLADKLPERVQSSTVNGTKRYKIFFPHNAGLTPRGPTKTAELRKQISERPHAVRR